MNLNQEEALFLFLKNINKYKFIAHRLGFVMEGYPENSLKNVESIFNNPDSLNQIDGIEFDIKFAVDTPVVLHDDNTSDISETIIKVRNTNYDELGKIKCGYRRSEYNSDIPWNENNNFYIQTLDTFLAFFGENKDKIKDKVIRIESKTIFPKKEDIVTFKQIISKYKNLKDNIVHISFMPWNLKNLRKLEKEDGTPLTRTELLADFKWQKRLFSRFWDSSIDGISLGLKEVRDKGKIELTKEAKRTSKLNALFYENRNALSEEWLYEIIKKYGYAGIYTINDIKGITDLLNIISPQFLEEYANRLLITSDNPKYLRTLEL